jgi:hypothetical protein
MATTEQGATQPHDDPMDKLRISNGQIEAAPFGPALPADAGTPKNGKDRHSEIADSETANGLLDPELRRNFIIPPKERALECIAVLLNLARSNLGTSQRNLHASRRAEKDQELAHWKWESLHWLRRCGKWSNHKRKVESR